MKAVTRAEIAQEVIRAERTYWQPGLGNVRRRMVIKAILLLVAERAGWFKALPAPVKEWVVWPILFGIDKTIEGILAVWDRRFGNRNWARERDIVLLASIGEIEKKGKK